MITHSTNEELSLLIPGEAYIFINTNYQHLIKHVLIKYDCKLSSAQIQQQMQQLVTVFRIVDDTACAAFHSFSDIYRYFRSRAITL